MWKSHVAICELHEEIIFLLKSKKRGNRGLSIWGPLRIHHRSLSRYCLGTQAQRSARPRESNRFEILRNDIFLGPLFWLPHQLRGPFQIIRNNIPIHPRGNSERSWAAFGSTWRDQALYGGNMLKFDLFIFFYYKPQARIILHLQERLKNLPYLACLLSFLAGVGLFLRAFSKSFLASLAGSSVGTIKRTGSSGS